MPRLIVFKDLKARGVLLGRRQIDRLEKAGKFPRRVPISASRVAWVAEEIDQWVTDKINSRPEPRERRR